MTIKEKIVDLYENVVKNLKKEENGIYSFISEDGTKKYYSQKLEAIFETMEAVEKYGKKMVVR